VPPAPVAIADSEIIPRAEQTVNSLQKLRSDIVSDLTLPAIEKDFAEFAADSDRRRENEAEAISKSRSVQRLNQLRREWNFEHSQLEEWEQALSRRSQFLAAREKEVNRIQALWSATQVAVAKKFFFKAVQRRVYDVLREVEATRVAIQEHTTKLLKLQSEIADRLADLAKIREEIDQAREEFSRNLFALDSPPLWHALFSSQTPGAIRVEAADSVRKLLDDLQDLAAKHSERILLHLIIFLTIIGVVYFLRRDFDPATAEENSAAAALFVLNRPFSSAMLLALIPMLLALIPAGLFYPGAWGGILHAAIVPTVISVIRLLPELLPNIAPRWIYFAVALYLVDSIHYLFPEDWLLARLLLFAIAAGGCVGLALFLRSPMPRLTGTGSKKRLAPFAARLGLILFAMSAVSNVFGNLTLADFLVVAPIRITYSGALIFLGAHVLLTLTMVALQSRSAQSLRSVRVHNQLIGFRCRALIRIGALIFWAAGSLYIVGVLGDFLALGADFLQWRWKLGAAEISVSNLATFLAVLFATVVVLRMLRFVLQEEIFPRMRLPRGVPGALDVLSHYGVLLLGFLIALAAAGVDFSKVTLLISALGVGIGFGMQNLVNNFVSGLILVFEHPVQVGDYVEIGSMFGEVRRIGFRASVLRTPDGADVIVPNSELVGSRVINWSLFDRLRRINISVGTAYGTDPNRVIDVLIGIARKHPAVLAYPEPQAVFDRFAESSLNFTLLCWTDVDKFFLARSELTIAINEGFKEAGIQIPFPQQEVFVHWPGEADAAVAQPSEPASEIIQGRSPERALFLSGKGSVAKK
jgi:potassium-dependent mechanosensitive channel